MSITHPCCLTKHNLLSLNVDCYLYHSFISHEFLMTSSIFTILDTLLRGGDWFPSMVGIMSSISRFVLSHHVAARFSDMQLMCICMCVYVCQQALIPLHTTIQYAYLRRRVWGHACVCVSLLCWWPLNCTCEKNKTADAFSSQNGAIKYKKRGWIVQSHQE